MPLACGVVRQLAEVALCRDHRVAVHVNAEVGGVPVFGSVEELRLFEPQVLVSVGGDGTLLESARLAAPLSVPVMGVNTGRLGFLALFSPGDLDSLIAGLERGEFRREERTLLEVRVSGRDYTAVNDAVIHRGLQSSMIELEVYVDGEYVGTYRADGVIVSTPTGSTAYSLSCGGPVVAPDAPVFLITPIAPHNLSLRPLVIADSSEVEIRVGDGGEALLSVDTFSFAVRGGVVVRKSSFRLSLLVPRDYTFLGTLRSKLGWAADIREKTNRKRNS